jgi:hypothetical protein
MPKQCRTLGMICAFALLCAPQVNAQVNVTTYHYDTSSTGQNLNEQTLAPANVNPTQFGKLFSYPLDGFAYSQPLYLTGVIIPQRGTHNVVYVATEHDSVYAFDADNPDTASGGGLLWQRSFINPGAGITPVPTADLYPASIPDIQPEIGITGTPVIDYNASAGTGTLYVVVKTKEMRGSDVHYVQRLRALDVGSGLDRILANGQLIGDTTADGTHDPGNPCVPGTGDGSQAGRVCFHARRQNDREGLALWNGIVYVAFASHGDQGPYHGWVLGYRASDLGLAAVFNSTPNGGLGGFWEGGGVPVFDAADNMYLSAGNGTFRTDPDGTQNYGQGIIKLSSTPDDTGMLHVLDFFTSYEQAVTNQFDLDQGSGGILLLPEATGRLVQTGKRGKIFLLDRNNMGQYRHGVGCDQEPMLETCDSPVQFTPNGTISGGSYGSPAYFTDGTNQFVYYGGNGDTIKQFQLDPGTGLIALPPLSQSTDNFGFTGVTPTISASGINNAILWGLNVNGYGIPARPNPSPMILFAYDASDLGTLLYSSAMSSQRDQMGDGVKFNTPTVANGRVYVGTQGNRADTFGTLEVFGLFNDAVALPAPPSGLMAASGPAFPAPPSIILNWTNSAPDATGINIERSLNGTDFAQVAQVARDQSTFTDLGVQASTTYTYRVKATNQIGDSGPSNTATARTHIGGPALTIDDIFDTAVSLKWTATANDHYVVGRSTDGTCSASGTTVPAGTTTFTDTVPSFGTFFYCVTAFNSDGDHATSNTMSATVGPSGVSHGGGFASHGDLTANANTVRAIFQGNLIRLTDGQNGEGATVFTSSTVGIRRFTTSFTFRAQPGTNPMADGLAFIIQGTSPMALGASGGGLGYSGIQNSVAIKFDLFNHGHGGYSTGQYVDGHTPDTPGTGEADISLVGTGIDLTSGHVFKVDLTYDGTRLVETITDQSTSASLTIDDYPPVDISGHVGADTGFVGFGAGTGGLNAIQDILTWTYTENEAGLPPRKPSNLHITNIQQVDPTHFNITLGWKGNNAYTATRFRVERSTDGTTFTQIADVPVSQTTYTDPNQVAPGTYFYRVRSFDGTRNSAYTPVVCAPLGTGGGIDHSSGFACHGDLSQNGNMSFNGTNARLTDGGGSEASSTFTVNRFNIQSFHTTFTLRIHDPANADGMCFVIQGNDPNQLGGSGGGLGYGSDTRGGPRGIRNSICLKFDIYDNQGEGPNSTGLFGDGRSPTLPERDSGDTLVDLQPTPINLHSQDVFRVDLVYDGTTLTETITDLNTTNSFTVPGGYLVNIPAMVGGNTAFLGFTGGTGGLTATQDVQAWTFRNP